MKYILTSINSPCGPLDNASATLIEVAKGHVLCSKDALFWIRSGNFKKIKLSEDGREQIANFYYSNEIIGCSTSFGPVSNYCIIAIKDSIVYRIKENHILHQMTSNPIIQSFIFQLMTRRMSLGATVVLNANADERIMAFLLDIYARTQIKNSLDDMILPMSYKDLANYLGLSAETISRRLSILQKRGYFGYKNRSFWNFNFSKMQLLIA